MSVTPMGREDGGTISAPAIRNGVPPATGKAVTDIGTANDNGTTTADSRNACGYCRREVAVDEPVWLLRKRTGRSITRANGTSYPVSKTVWACRACALPRIPRCWHDKPFHIGRYVQDWQRQLLEPFVGQLVSRCDGCGRSLGRTNFWPDRSCSPACSRDVRNRRQRRDQVEHRCECGRTFTGRADAVYCSNACRQRAYRQRGVKP